MFSKRLEWSEAQNALTKRLALRTASDPPLVNLTESNPTKAGLFPQREAVMEALRDKRSLAYEPSAFGLLEAREAVAGYYSRRVKPEQVVLTASTSEAYSYLFKLLCQPGDEVLVPRPSYPMFEHLAMLDSVSVQHYPLHYHEGWWIDLDALARSITPRTKAIVTVNPNNPTGSYLKRNEYTWIAELCDRHDLALISDEVFADYALNTSTNTVKSVAGSEDCLTFALSGMSKVAGLPQMKLGWMAVSGPKSGEALSRLEWIADTYLSVSAPVQHAARKWFPLIRDFQAGIIQRLNQNLPQAGALHCEGGWNAIIALPREKSGEQWALRFLDKQNVLVQPGYFYDFEKDNCAVVSLITPPEVFAEGIKRIHSCAGLFAAGV
jgi:aspartate/methionine/tyrosine aminotransferase